jgi:hypothetical protein
VGASIVGGFFVHKEGRSGLEQKCTSQLSEEAMTNTQELTAEQEAQVQELATLITEAVASDVLKIARLLVCKDTRHTFGQTEFHLRDLIHRAGAKALELSLRKKTRLPRIRYDLP